MRHFCISSLAALLLTGCGNGGGDSGARQYQILSDKEYENGKPQKLCDKATEVADAYLREENTEKYNEWTSKAENDCRLANSISEFDDAAKNANDAIGNLR